MGAPFEAKTLYDSFFAFEGGMNAGVAPLLLPKNQMAFATNVTVRGDFATHRPTFRKMTLDFGGDATLQSRFTTGRFQGAGYYKPDNATGTLCAAISGRLFQVGISGTVGTVREPPLAAGGPPTTPTPYPRPTNRPQAWLWQSEKWMNWNDGVSQCVFFDNVEQRGSNFGTPVQFTTTTTATFVILGIGSTSLAVPFTATAPNLVVGDIVTIPNRGTMQVVAIAGLNVDLLNLTATPNGYTVASGVTVSWTHQGAELPPGRMAAYGMGRNWESLVDGKQFVASDLVGGSSGTVANNYRDAVLNITENLYLSGGGNFTVPGNPGDIKAMKFVATLDVSLGQGPLQVLTPNTVFSCQAPVDRLTWQDVTNPILTESLITNGGLSQNATVLANGDLIFRSKDGIRSLKLSRAEWATWGSTPISNEIEPILSGDNETLLPYTSAVVFDNRLLMTVGGVVGPQEMVYWKGFVSLNFDPVSSLRGKQPSVWEGLWLGLNTLQIITGEFDAKDRCFAFTYNAVSNEIELWEVLRDSDAYYDNLGTSTRRITWAIESPVLDFGQKDPKKREMLRLRDGELHVADMLGPVDFEVFYAPDQWPCWFPWFSWQECAKAPDQANPSTRFYQPQFRPAMGLGQPSSTPCDETNNRPAREGYSFRVKLIITGQCTVLGFRAAAHTVPVPVFAKQSCQRICRPEEEETVREITTSGVQLVNAVEAYTENDGTVVPIITSNMMMAPNQYGRVRNLVDGLWYDLIGYTMNDGTIVPICDQTSHATPGPPVPMAQPPHYGRVRNAVDGKWYEVLSYTENDGTLVPILDQTPHNNPTGP